MVLQTDKKPSSHKDPIEGINLPTSPKITQKPESPQARNMRNIQKELSFLNLEVIHGSSSPRKKPLKLNLVSLDNNNEENNIERGPRKEISFINLEFMNQSPSPKKKPINQKKPEENFEDFDNWSVSSPVSKKKKEKVKMELKFATLGEFEINNLEKEQRKTEGLSPRFTEAKSIKSVLNEEDCDIALIKKPYKKFQTTQDDNRHKRNSQIDEMINLKKQMKEMENNKDDATPIFDHTKNFKF